MGHRANYAIRENGTYRLYYSHWGALTVPEDVFWGPDAAESFITSHDEIDPTDWLDDVWGEGGVALDKDSKTLALFGGESLGFGPLYPTFSALMDVLWSQQGWAVRWVAGMPDIAEQAGADPQMATASPVGPFPVDPETLGERYYAGKVIDLGTLPLPMGDLHESLESVSTKNIHTLLSLSKGAVGWDDGVVDARVIDFLAAGPEVLDFVQNLPSLEEVRAYHSCRPLRDWEEQRPRLGQELTDTVAIDRERKLVWVGVPHVSTHEKECIREAWDEWTVTFHNDGMFSHYTFTERSCPADLAPVHEQPVEEPMFEAVEDVAEPTQELELEEALKQIAEILLGPRNLDPSVFLKEYMQNLTEEEGYTEIIINQQALQSPQDGRPHEADCLALFEDAVYALQHRPCA